MSKAVVFFADGTEECEALLVVDLLNAPDKQLRRYVGEEGMRKLRNGTAPM